MYIHTYCDLHVKYSCQIPMKLEFSWQIFEKNTQISNSNKIRPVGTEVFNVDRRTDMTKLTVAFRKFYERA